MSDKVYIGTLEKKTVDKTAKRQRRALFLRVTFPDDSEVFVVRRRGLGAFQEDYELDALVGKQVAFQGVVQGTILVADSWKVV